MRYRIATYAAAVVIALLSVALVSSWIERREVEKALNRYIVGDLMARGFHEGRRGTVKIPELPTGTTPLVSVEGTVRYPPSPGSARPDTAPLNADGPPQGHYAPVPSPSSGPGAPACDLGALALDIRCRAEVVEAAGKPWARLMVSGQVKGYGQTRDLPETAAGDVAIVVDRGVSVPRWAAEIRAGIEADRAGAFAGGARWSAGASVYGRGRLGGWIQATPDSVSGGVAVGLGRLRAAK